MTIDEATRKRWYDEAFKRWWDEDYSWDGLARKTAVGGDGNPQSLQLYWRNEEPHLVEFAGRRWAAFHLPPHAPDGTTNSIWERIRTRFNTQLTAYYEGGAAAYNASSEPDFVRRPMAQLQGVIFRDQLHGVPNSQIVANFSDAIFLSDKPFAALAFGSPLLFKRALFAKGVRFDHTGQPPANMSDATVLGDLHFATQINGAVSFANLKLAGRANLGGILLYGPLDFSRAVFGADANFSGDNPVPGMKFDSARFCGPANFSGRSFSRATSFKGAEFLDLAMFYGCGMHKNTSFVRTKFANVRRRRASHSAQERVDHDSRAAEFESAFRVLREHAVSNSNHENEGDFYALELDARVQRSDIPTFEKLIARLFALTSSYGRDALLPWIWWIAAVSTFTLIAAVLVTCALGDERPAFGSLLATVIGQFVPLPSAWQAITGEGKIPTWLYKIREGYPLEFGLFSTAAALVTISLLGAFLITLRRRFALK